MRPVVTVVAWSVRVSVKLITTMSPVNGWAGRDAVWDAREMIVISRTRFELVNKSLDKSPHFIAVCSARGNREKSHRADVRRWWWWHRGGITAPALGQCMCSEPLDTTSAAAAGARSAPSIPPADRSRARHAPPLAESRAKTRRRRDSKLRPTKRKLVWSWSKRQPTHGTTVVERWPRDESYVGRHLHARFS